MKRSLLSVSLRALILLVTLVAAGLAIGKQVYYERYARHLTGHQYFESLGADVKVGDPCPTDFVFYVDAHRRYQGLAVTDTPDFWDRLAGRRLSYPAVRELSFRTPDFVNHERFNVQTAANLTKLTPYLEFIELPVGAKTIEGDATEVVDTTIGNLIKLEELRMISILDWPITDDHVKALTKLPHIQVISIYSPRLTDRCLVSIRTLKELRVISLNSPQLTDAAAEALHRDRPRLFGRINQFKFGDPNTLYQNRNQK